MPFTDEEIVDLKRKLALQGLKITKIPIRKEPKPKLGLVVTKYRGKLQAIDEDEIEDDKYVITKRDSDIRALERMGLIELPHDEDEDDE